MHTAREFRSNTPTARLRRVQFITDAFPDRPGLDTAVSRVSMLEASAGNLGETLRLYVPERIVAFGKRDTRDAGYGRAVAAARRMGFLGIERLAGGRAAVFHPGTIAFAWTVPDPDPAERIHARFQYFAGVLHRALSALGADARIGEIEGEYCPGEYSISLGGRIKVVGIGQRLARRAAHVGGVIVVTDGEAVRNVLVPVYEALGLGWRPGTAGALEDAVPGITVPEVLKAVAASLATDADLHPRSIEPAVVDQADALRHEHLSPVR